MECQLLPVDAIVWASIQAVTSEWENTGNATRVDSCRGVGNKDQDEEAPSPPSGRVKEQGRGIDRAYSTKTTTA